MTALPTIKESTLKELIDAQSVRGARLVADGSGFAMVVRYGVTERALASTRGQVRLFASLNTAAEFLRRIGLSTFEVDAANYAPGRLRAPRPDRAAALARTSTKPKQAALFK